MNTIEIETRLCCAIALLDLLSGKIAQSMELSDHSSAGHEVMGLLEITGHCQKSLSEVVHSLPLLKGGQS